MKSAVKLSAKTEALIDRAKAAKAAYDDVISQHSRISFWETPHFRTLYRAQNERNDAKLKALEAIAAEVGVSVEEL